MGDTQIPWATKTWNPTVGCTKVSPGCDNCYAIRSIWRMAHNPNPTIAKNHQGIAASANAWTGEVRCLPQRLEIPSRWKKPQRVFVCSMSDLWHTKVADNFIVEVLSTAVHNPNHRYLFLTKRPERIAETIRILEVKYPIAKIVNDHLWFGVTAENQEMADYRIPILMAAPVKHRWVSVEPILSSVKLSDWLYPGGIEWVVAGCESGKHARIDMPRYYEYLIEQCAETPAFPTGIPSTPLFIKQARTLNSGTVDSSGQPWLPITHMPKIMGRVWGDYPEGLSLPSDFKDAIPLESIL